jgi:predicted O-methyltransferase YrrM
MEAHIHNLLRELYASGQQNDAGEQERSKKMLNLEPDTAQFVSMLARSSKRKRLLEIGTSNGYSTIWLAWAAQFTEGHVISIDRDEQKLWQADVNLRHAKLREFVDLFHGDANEIVTDFPGPFDFVLFDADRISAPKQLALLLPKLAPDVFILADNALSHPDEIAGYLDAIKQVAGFEHMVVPVGKGLSMAYMGEGA